MCFKMHIKLKNTFKLILTILYGILCSFTYGLKTYIHHVSYKLSAKLKYPYDNRKEFSPYFSKRQYFEYNIISEIFTYLKK